MTNADIEPNALKSRLSATLAADGRVRLAVLFGSVASGKVHARSDIDIAFVPMRSDLSLDEELKLQVDLSRASGRIVDLVRLDRASTLVRWQALRAGILLFESSPFEFTRATAAAAIEYFDFAPALEAAAARYRRTIANTRSPVKTS
jgi:predicted nucleotidyltransferase